MLLNHNIINRDLVPFLQGLNHDCLFILCDRKVYDLHTKELEPLVDLLEDKETQLQLIDAGETCKTSALLIKLWRWLKEGGATRKSLLLNIGGGTVTDLGGFVASTYMRGIRTVNLPTTLLAMVDASVGGKTGINFDGIKNLVGSFHQSEKVFIDINFLDTLPLDELFSGYAELIKTALLSGGELWELILHTEDPQYLTREDWIKMIGLSINYKHHITTLDPEEKGLRKCLNLGHTVGHALESLSFLYGTRPLLHGEAVIIGIVIELYIAYKLYGLTAQRTILAQLKTICQDLYPKYDYACRDYDEFIELMLLDKKNESGYITLMLLNDLGKVEEYHLTDLELLKEGFDFYREGF